MNINGQEVKELSQLKCWCRTCKQDKTEAEMFAGVIHPDGVGRGLCTACRSKIIGKLHTN